MIANIKMADNPNEMSKFDEVLDFFKDLVEESGFRLHTAGTLFGGNALREMLANPRYWIHGSSTRDRRLADSSSRLRIRPVQGVNASRSHSTMPGPFWPPSIPITSNRALCEANAGRVARNISAVRTSLSCFARSTVTAALDNAPCDRKRTSTNTRQSSSSITRSISPWRQR